MADRDRFDVVVIGSGFGGAVTACRLAEAGYGVLVLERGHRWGPRKGLRDEGNREGSRADPDVMPFPRDSRDAWLWDHRHPERSHGWIDFRKFPNMGVIQGSGVGGGSLIYANVTIDAEREAFEQGWPTEISWIELEPYYKKVSSMLQLRPVPEGQWSARLKLLREGADTNRWGGRFKLADLAVQFDDDFTYDSSERPDPRNTKRDKNPHGAWQGTCAQLGNCDVGCDVGARNTLDKNYLFVAEAKEAKVWPRHLVRSIAPEGNGYRVHFDRIEEGRFEPGSVFGGIVIVAAGSLGSTELLLRCRDQYRTLPSLSRFLGMNWSGNGDFLTTAFYFFRKPLYPGRGIVFSGSLNFLDGRSAASTPAGQGTGFNIEDGGFPYRPTRALVRYIAMDSGGDPWRPKLFRLAIKALAAIFGALHWLAQIPGLKALRNFVEWIDPFNRLMPWVAQGQDASDGILSLKDGELSLEWRHEKSRAVIDEIYETHKKLSRATGGWVLPALGWTSLHTLVTPHPLGGCSMGPDEKRGVVNHKGEAFGYRRLYVADGAVIPKAIGLNPSKTIAALAERIAEHIITDHPCHTL